MGDHEFKKRYSLSVIFLTLNEEFHIADAIDNVADIADEIFVLDSLSTDRTVEIAQARGAKVVQRPFTNFGDQWNFALDNLPITTIWTMKMDPDERLQESLKAEIRQCLSLPRSCRGFGFNRVFWFMGKPLHMGGDRVVRIWTSGSCRFTDVTVNEHPIVQGEIAWLKGKMDHLDSANLHQWIIKQNNYTTLEALRHFNGEKMAAEPRLFGSGLERRMFFKSIFFKLPFRYVLMFLQLYLLKGAWKGGRTGLHYVLLRIWVRRLIESKILEMRNTGRLIALPPLR